MPKKIVATLMIAIIGSLVSAPLGSAKSISKIIRETGLTPDDFKIMGATADPLYATGSPKPGKVVSWTNPDSQSHGTVKLAAMRGNCAYLQHLAYPKGSKKVQEIRLRVCRNDQGKWLLQP